MMVCISKLYMASHHITSHLLGVAQSALIDLSISQVCEEIEVTILVLSEKSTTLFPLKADGQIYSLSLI